MFVNVTLNFNNSKNFSNEATAGRDYVNINIKRKKKIARKKEQPLKRGSLSISLSFTCRGRHKMKKDYVLSLVLDEKK